MPGLTHAEQRQVEAHLDLEVDNLVARFGENLDAVRAGVAEWAMRFALKAGLLEEPRMIVRRADRRRR